MKVKLLEGMLIFLLAIVSMGLQAQVKTKIFNDGIPASLIAPKIIIPEKIISAPDGFSDAMNEAKSTKNSLEYSNKFALQKSVNLDVLSLAKVTQEKNSTVYLFSVNAENAVNISLQFNKFFLPENSVLSIYNQFELTDSITTKENNENNIWATRVYQGNKLTLELRLQGENDIYTIQIKDNDLTDNLKLIKQ